MTTTAERLAFLLEWAEERRQCLDIHYQGGTKQQYHVGMAAPRKIGLNEFGPDLRARLDAVHTRAKREKKIVSTVYDPAQVAAALARMEAAGVFFQFTADYRKERGNIFRCVINSGYWHGQDHESAGNDAGFVLFDVMTKAGV